MKGEIYGFNCFKVYCHWNHGISVFAGVGERSREGNDLYNEMKSTGVLAKSALVFGQMNEPPGARMRVGLTALTIAENFRDSMIFVDV